MVEAYSSSNQLPKLRVGIIGVARIARKNVLAIESPVSNCMVSAVCSRHFEKASNFVKEFCTSHRDILIISGENAYAELVESEGLCDAVYIPLPTSLHKEWVIRALKAGKHVLVEKPVAVTYEDYVEMRQVALDHKKFIMDGTMFVHNPRMDRFVECVTNKDTFGEIDRINATFSFSAGQDFFGNDIRTKTDGDPLGCIGDLGWYCIRAAIVLYCNYKKLPVKAAQVVQWKLTDDGIPIDAQCFVFFDQVSHVRLFDVGLCQLVAPMDDAEQERDALYSFSSLGLVSEQDHLLNFHCSFLHSMRQRIEVVGRKRCAECLDFVVPRGGLASVFHVHEREIVGIGEHSIEKTDTVELPSGPPQEVMMWRTFSRLARAVDSDAKGNVCTADWGNSDASKMAFEISSVSLETQRVTQALMESIRANGTKIEMAPTSPELLGIGVYLGGQGKS